MRVMVAAHAKLTLIQGVALPRQLLTKKESVKTRVYNGDERTSYGQFGGLRQFHQHSSQEAQLKHS